MIKYRRYATESSLALGQVDKGPAIWCWLYEFYYVSSYVTARRHVSDR